VGEEADDAVIAASLEAPQAFGQIFDRHAPVVHRFLTSRAGTGAADDLLSEVFAVAFRTRAAYDARCGSVVPWLLGIANNVVRHHHRSEGRRAALLTRLVQCSDRSKEMLDDIAIEVTERTELAGVRRALAAIDERYQEVLILYSAFELSYAEIGQVLGLRVGTVRSRLSRGRAQLRERMAGSGQYSSGERIGDARTLRVEGSSQ
jgi:RNA polymerase sigma factor (sigma-70 family)